MTTLKAITKTAAELGQEAKGTVEDLGRTANKKLDAVRTETGAALHTAASTVRETGRQSSTAIDNFAKVAANRLDATASLVEDHDLNDAVTGLRRFGRKHFAGSLVFAAVVGFFVGSALSKGGRSGRFF